MRLARRRVLVACSIIATATVILSVATIQPTTQKELPLHTTALTNATPPAPKNHHHPLLSGPRSLLSGIGSWYGDMFDGRPTASGEIFDQSELTACHPTLPFGTLVRVINLRNRRSVIVRINDRGIRPDRIIDLSSAAAEKIGMLGTGVAPVKLEIVPKNRS